MKKVVIFVPTGKRLLGTLIEMRERAKDSRISLHDNTIEELKNAADYFVEENRDLKLVWNSTPKSSVIIISIKYGGTWHRVNHILANKIYSEYEFTNPKALFFVKMIE